MLARKHQKDDLGGNQPDAWKLNEYPGKEHQHLQMRAEVKRIDHKVDHVQKPRQMQNMEDSKGHTEKNGKYFFDRGQGITPFPIIANFWYKDLPEYYIIYFKKSQL